jgi:hypothetical protein
MIVSNSSCLIILIRLKKLDLLQKIYGKITIHIRDLLDQMMSLDFRVSKAVYDDALELANEGRSRKPRRPGALKGKIKISDDFDELPADISAAFGLKKK